MKKLLIFLTLGLLSLNAGAVELKEGTNYDLITPAPPVGSGDEVEVVEFFMYTCPHCNHLEPSLQEWTKKLPENVKFHHIPAMFGGAANLHARNFFALEVMGEEGRLHNAWFKAIHEQKQRLRTQADIDKFLEKNGVDMNKFHATLNSFTVQTKTNRAAALMRRYGVRSVPMMIVDGRYRIKNTPQVLENTDALIEKTLADRKK
ncbi:thiol:disulfide interchange protein DsbA/DsbL [Thiolapillus brandeum]|uniref:Thiol:disulfide interchange protein n=1 Tax=Thiolapillus brandeum TaxID=1076588 RepID=A0A7U6GGP9_9GAMM|nr:thiol:disulfide interchange protein DsbA/DsbL [Thiolapillus brandeum]BAO43325.1 thiol:disulfide interchange protein DsbA [Thiolapillus brandeum]